MAYMVKLGGYFKLRSGSTSKKLLSSVTRVYVDYLVKKDRAGV